MTITAFIRTTSTPLHDQMTTNQANQLLLEQQIFHAPVVNAAQEFLGIYTVQVNQGEQLLQTISLQTSTTITPETQFHEIPPHCFQQPFIPVVQEQKLVGIIFPYDLTRQLIQDSQQLSLELKHVQQNYKEINTIFENSYDGFAITNHQGITIRVNRAWDRLTGLKRSDIIGVPLEQLVKKGFFSDSVTMKVIENQQTTSIVQKMNNGKQAIMTGTPIFDTNHQLQQVIINIRDISELQELRENLLRKELLTEQYKTEISQLRIHQAETEGIIAESSVMQNLLELASRIAKVNSTVLLTGESGVGKGVIARFIHRSNQGKAAPFITVNCGAIPEQLLESELFGYVEGAFTGAQKKGKVGLFELANGGTLFLDEIGEMPLALQVKLLHVLQEKQLTRLGDTKSIDLDFRLIAATNKDLKQLIAQGEFREDLFYRIHVVPLTIPPLREREADIFPLTTHFVNLYNEKYQLNKKISNSLIATLATYSWPGNIREFSNVIERLLVTAQNDLLTGEDFMQLNTSAEATYSFANRTLSPLKETVKRVEKEAIKQALEQTNTQLEAAQLLGISLSTLLRKAKGVS